MNEVLESATIILKKTPGQILKAAREAKQISISEVTQRLLLSKNVIIAIENDDYSKIAAPVYAEGYLKAYAQFLQVPVDMVLMSFRRLDVYPKSEIKIETNIQTRAPVGTDTRQSTELLNLFKGRRRWHVIAGGISILVVIIFINKQFFNKNAEVIRVSDRDNRANGVARKSNVDDAALPDNHNSIIITANSENVTSVNSQGVSKNKQAHKNMGKTGIKNTPLMLDVGTTVVRSNDYDKVNAEPNLVLVNPDKPTT